MNIGNLKDRYHWVAFIVLIIVTMVSQLLHAHLDIINVALIHLIPIIVIALLGEMFATMSITVLTVVLFDFLYVPPRYSFHVHDLIYIWSFLIFFLLGYIMTTQAKRIHTDKIKQMVLNTLSHDLKTPLASIMGNTTLLLDDQLDEASRRDVLTQIKSSSERMDRLIGTLLDSARIGESDTVLQKEWCDLEDLIGVTLQEFDHQKELNRLQVRIDEGLDFFWADNALLVRILVNLLENAFKYGEEEKAIQLDIASTPKSLKIAVCNESRPIPEEELRHLFERFYRLDTTSDIDGSGIGLAICKEIATAHQGSVQAYNIDGGVCFEVELPILRPYQDRMRNTYET